LPSEDDKNIVSQGTRPWDASDRRGGTPTVDLPQISRLEALFAHGDPDPHVYTAELAALQQRLNELRSRQWEFLAAIQLLEGKLGSAEIPMGLRAILCLVLGLNNVPSSVLALQELMLTGSGGLGTSALLGLSLGRKPGVSRDRATEQRYWLAAVEYYSDVNEFQFPGAAVLAQKAAPSRKRASLEVDRDAEFFMESLSGIPASNLGDKLGRIVEGWARQDLWVLYRHLALDTGSSATSAAAIAMGSTDTRLCNTVVEALRLSTVREAVDHLEGLAQSLTSGNARANALHVFAEKSRDSTIVTALTVQRLSIELDFDVIRVAVQILTRSSDERAIRALAENATAGSVERRIIVIKGLRDTGRDVQTALKSDLCAQLCQDPDPEIRAVAIETLAAVDSRRGRDVAKLLVADPDPRVVSLARKILIGE
jgi:hypothetical protein